MMMALANKGVIANLMSQGVIVRSAFCGPCFGAGDVPGHGGLSIRHTTRNFPNREGSKPGEGQEAYVALMEDVYKRQIWVLPPPVPLCLWGLDTGPPSPYPQCCK